MKRLGKWLVVLLFAMLLCGCSKQKDYEVLNTIDKDSVLFFFVKEEMQDDGHVNQYLMALTKDSEVIPLVRIERASYLKKIYRAGEEIYLYNDMKYFYHDEEMETLDRSLIKFNYTTGKVSKDTSISNDERNYYFSTETYGMEEISSIRDKKIKSTLEVDDGLIVQYSDNTIARLDGQYTVVDKRSMQEYSLIFYLVSWKEDILIVGMDTNERILIEKMDNELNVLSKCILKNYDNVELCVTDGNILGIGLKVDKGNQLLSFDSDLNSALINEEFAGDILLFLQETNEFVYYDRKRKSYLAIDGTGKQLEEYPIRIVDKEYNFPYGKLYIE